MATTPNYDALTLSGGGIKGILTLGALHYYHENNILDISKLKELSGTSIGSMICLLLVCGYTPQEIFEEIRDSLNSFVAYDINILQLAQTFGLCSIDPLIVKLKEMVSKKMDGKVPTLKSLYDITGKTLMVCVVNRTTKLVEIYSHLTHPKLNCADAVKMSCSLPLIFPRIRYNGCYIIDGGILDNVPHRYISESIERLLCIATIGETKPPSVETIFTYIFDLITLPINRITDLNLESIRENSDTIIIKHNGPILPSNLSQSDTIDMFLLGFETAEMHNEMVDVVL